MQDGILLTIPRYPTPESYAMSVLSHCYEERFKKVEHEEQWFDFLTQEEKATISGLMIKRAEPAFQYDYIVEDESSSDSLHKLTEFLICHDLGTDGYSDFLDKQCDYLDSIINTVINFSKNKINLIFQEAFLNIEFYRDDGYYDDDECSKYSYDIQGV